VSGRVVILSGPSGVGKDTVLDQWIANDPRVVRVITYTTRLPRPGETHGVDYHFVNREEFFERAEAGDFLEYKEVHGNMYASPLRDTIRLRELGRIPVLKIDVQGALVAMEKIPDALSVFLLPPSGEELARRIRSRGVDSNESVSLRLRNAQSEIALADRYQVQIVNHSVEGVIDRLRELVP
jgi:guanylate kinase